MARFWWFSGYGALLGLAGSLTISACQTDPAGPRALPGVTIAVTPAELTLPVGGTAALAATVHNFAGQALAGRKITWSSSAPDIVAVSASGIVTARGVGVASVGAYSDGGVGFARVAVHIHFSLPLARGGRWLVLAEMGTPASECPGNEGGLRISGDRDCSHAGVSRYSLDFADAAQWEGSPSGPPEVLAAADGVLAGTCLHAPAAICGPNGHYITVEHPGGFITLYAHIDSASVTLPRKTAVRRGEPLGTMGARAGDRAPWLHFELRREPPGRHSASVLDEVELDGRRFSEYLAGELPDD